jgi:formylglycine-generating enzyme required for sulfatase activity
MSAKTAVDDVVGRAREALALDSAGLPVCRDSAAVLRALRAIHHLGDEIYDELVRSGFLAGAAERRSAVLPLLRRFGDARFDMGTPVAGARHFSGETPRHTVELSAFLLAEIPVTSDLFGLLDPGCRDLPDVLGRAPVVNVSWFDAALFAAWVGCRLPTEAEWEFACGAGTSDEWCCVEADLPRYAWYSENAAGEIHPAGTREPNEFGLMDMHGNVWEWCEDHYSQDFYSRSPARDPVNDGAPADQLRSDVHRVSRGGGFLALSEMCRVRYRLHDPASYYAMDLGFRLASSAGRIETDEEASGNGHGEAVRVTGDVAARADYCGAIQTMRDRGGRNQLARGDTSDHPSVPPTGPAHFHRIGSASAWPADGGERRDHKAGERDSPT